MRHLSKIRTKGITTPQVEGASDRIVKGTKWRGHLRPTSFGKQMTCSGSQWNICLHLSANFQMHCFISHWLNCTRSQTEKGSCRDSSDNPVFQSTEQNGMQTCRAQIWNGRTYATQLPYEPPVFECMCEREKERQRYL